MRKSICEFITGYLNEGGQLKLDRFEKFMEEMAEIDRDLFREHYEDLKLFETKYVRYARTPFFYQIDLLFDFLKDNDETFGANISELPTAKMDPALAELVKRTVWTEKYFEFPVELELFKEYFVILDAGI